MSLHQDCIRRFHLPREDQSTTSYATQIQTAQPLRVKMTNLFDQSLPSPLPSPPTAIPNKTSKILSPSPDIAGNTSFQNPPCDYHPSTSGNHPNSSMLADSVFNFALTLSISSYLMMVRIPHSTNALGYSVLRSASMMALIYSSMRLYRCVWTVLP